MPETGNATYSGSKSRLDGAGASPLFFAIVVENEAAMFDRCVKAGLVKLEATGLATEAARSCLDADLKGRRERLSDDIVKPEASSNDTETKKINQLAKGS